MSAVEKTISGLIESQLPDFVNADHPQFKRFLELYYQWLENNSPDGVSNTAGNTIYHAMNIDNYRDIDQTPPEFVKYFKEELLPYFPENTSLSTEKILKAAREFYSKKGSDESLRWLFKALFDEDIEVLYPKEQIFITSDGKWVQPKAFRITVTEANKDVDPNLLERRQVVGVDSGATCVIERAERTLDPTNAKEILEIYVTNVKKYFNNGEFVEIRYIDENGTNRVFLERIIGTLSNIRVDSNIRTDPAQRRRGLFYNVGDPVVITGGLGLSAEANDAAAIVGDVTQGSIESVSILFGGYGYRLYSNTEVIVLRSQGDDPDANLSTDLRVLNVNLTACTSNSQKNFLEPITYDKSVIEYSKNILLSCSNIAVLTLNNHNIVLDVVEDDAGDYFLNNALVYANGLNYFDAKFKGKIATPNGNTKIAGTVNVSSATNAVTGTNTEFTFQLKVGQKLEIQTGERRTISTIVNNYYLTTTTAYSTTLTNQEAYRIGPFSAGPGEPAYSGGLLIYDVANTDILTNVLDGPGVDLQVLSVTSVDDITNATTPDKTFQFNSTTPLTYLVPANLESQICQTGSFVTENTGGIGLISVLNGGAGFRSAPDLMIDSYYDTQLSENYDPIIDAENKASTRQKFQEMGFLSHVYIDNGGTGYAINDTIHFEGRGYGGNGYVSLVDGEGSIKSVVLSDRGEGYTVRPTVYVNRLTPTYDLITGTVSINVANNTVVGTGTNFSTDLNIQNVIRVNNELKRVVTVVNNTILRVNSNFKTTGTGNLIYRQGGTEASLTAYLFGDGVSKRIQTSAIGRVREIKLLYRGYDYVDVPNVSLKVVDTVVNPILTEDPFVETEYIYQGNSFETATFKANVKQYNSTSGVLRLYNYSGRIDKNIDLKTANGIYCNVNTAITANVPAPQEYFPSVIATGLPNPMYYGNGRARARALFANGLIEFNGFYLNSDGFPSADKVFQDDKVFHNFSYIVQSEKNLVDFEVPIKNIIHPAGMALISKTVLKNEKDQQFVIDSNVSLILPGNGTEAISVSNSYSNVITGFQTAFDPLVTDETYPLTKVNVGDLFIIADGYRTPISRTVSKVTSNTELEIEGNFVYTGQGRIRSNTQFNPITGTVTVNPPITGTVQINPPVTGTVNVVSGSSLVNGNNSTTFTSNLAANAIVTINNQTRSVNVVISNDQFTVNSPFVYSGTDNLAYLTSNVVIGTGTNFDPEVSVGDIITIDNQIKKVTVRTSDNYLEVNTNFSRYSTGESLYKQNTQILGSSTLFNTNLAVNDIIKVNNQVRRVSSVTSDTLLTVNAGFDYYGTGNNIDKLSNTIFTVYNNQDFVDTIILEGDNISFNIFTSNSMVAQTGTAQVFTSNTKVVGSGTSFTTTLMPNDTIMIANQMKKVVNISSATVLNVNSVFSAPTSGELVYKRTGIINAKVLGVSSNLVSVNVAVGTNVENILYEVVPNYAQIVTIPGTVNTTSNIATGNTSNVDTPTNYVGKVFIGNQITIDSETKTVVDIIGNVIKLDTNWTSPGDDKYITVPENHNFNVVTLTAY